MKNALTIFIGVNVSWGAIEWILPACTYLKEHSNVNIIFVILRKSKSEIFRGNKKLENDINQITAHQCYDLFDILPKWTRTVADLIRFLLVNLFYRWKSGDYNIHNRIFRYWYKFSKKLFWNKSLIKWLDHECIDICLTDEYSEKAFFGEMKKRNVRIGYYPDASTTIFSPDVYFDFKPIKEKYIKNQFLEFDYYLSDTKWRTDFIKSLVDNKPTFGVGSPKYDSYWIDYLDRRATRGNDLLRISNNKKNILVLLKNEYSIDSYFQDFRQLLTDIIRVSLKDKNFHVIIKPHPRQNKPLLLSIMSQFPEERVSLSEVSSITLIAVSDIIISMPTSAIFDASIRGRPVIEYLDFVRINTVLKAKYDEIPKGVLGIDISMDSNGNLTSAYRDLQVAQGANNPKELESLLKANKDKTPQPTVRNIRDIFPDGACQRVADTIQIIAKESSDFGTSLGRIRDGN